MAKGPHWGVCPHCKRERPLAVIDGEGRCDLDRHEADRLAAVTAFAERSVNEGWDGPKGDAIRQERNGLLDLSLWAVMPGSPLSEQCQAEFVEYRKKLHRLTVDFPFPDAVEWPSQPTLEY